MAGKFEVYEDSAGTFRFRLKASNGEVVASGQGYATKASAKRACESVLKAAVGAPVVEMAAVPATAGPAAPDGGSELVPSPRRRPNGSAGPEAPACAPTPAQEPGRRHFRFTGGMSADSDLAARSGDILRDEFGRGT